MPELSDGAWVATWIDMMVGWFGWAGPLPLYIGGIGLAVATLFGVTLAWPFVMGWMGKARRAANGKAGS